MVARVVGDLAALVDDTLHRVDRRERLLRDDDGRPHHAAVDRRGPQPRSRDRPGSTTPRRCRPSRSRSGCSPGRSPAGRPDWESAGRDVRRGRAAVRDAEAVAAQRVPLPAGVCRVAPRARDRGRRHRRPRRPLVGRGVVGRRCAPPRPARGRRLRLPPGPARPLPQPAHPPPAGPDRRRRVAEGADPCGARHPGRARRAAASQPGATRIVAAWVAHLRGHGAPVTDAAAAEVVPLAQGDPGVAVRAVLAHLGIRSETVAATVEDQLADLLSRAGP